VRHIYQELPIASQSDVCTSQLAAVANMPHLQLQPHNRPHRCARHCQPQTFRTSIGGSSSNVSRLRSPQHRQQLSRGLTCVGAAEGEPSDEAGFGFDRAAMGTVYLQQQGERSHQECPLQLVAAAQVLVSDQGASSPAHGLVYSQRASRMYLCACISLGCMMSKLHQHYGKVVRAQHSKPVLSLPYRMRHTYSMLTPLPTAPICCLYLHS
jgi:hypothetical protein